MSNFSAPHFHNEEAAFAYVEGLIWPEGPICPHCGGVERITLIKANPEKRIRHGLKRCGQCKGQFTVRMGTIFEESRIAGPDDDPHRAAHESWPTLSR